MRRTRLAPLSVAVLLLATACTGAQSQAPTSLAPPASDGATPGPTFEPASVVIGLDAFGGAVPVYAAQQQGFFATYGITATIDTYSVGLDTLNAALAGTADFGWAFDYGSLGAMSADQLRYVATLSRNEPGFHKLALTAAVPAPEDLAGKRMGIVTGTQQHYVTLAYLDKLGIARDDVELVSFGAVLEIVAGMRTNQIGAAWVFGQGVDEAEKIEGVKIVADDGEVLTGGRGFLIATRKIVEEQADVVERVLRALVDAETWVKANDADFAITAAYIADQLKAPVDGVLANLQSTEVTVSFDQSDLDTLEDFAAFRTELTPDKPLDVEKYLALDPLRAVDPGRVSIP